MSISSLPTHDAALTLSPDNNVAAQQAMLHELAEIGTEFARLLRDQARAQEAGVGAETVARAALAYERVARAVRRSVGLAQRLGEPGVGASAGQERALARRRIVREVEDVIQRQARGGVAEGLTAELAERLDGPELEDEIGTRPVAEIIADICRDLGIAALPGTAPWQRRTPTDVARLCARAAALPPPNPPPSIRPRPKGA